MGGAVSAESSYDMVYTEQPHANRREKLLKTNPEVKELFGVDPSFKYVTTAIVLSQLLICYLVKDSSWGFVIAMTICSGGAYNHAQFLAIHEIAHNLAFGIHRPIANKLFGIFANLPMGVPVAIAFKKYHLEHHRYLGGESVDTDIPTEFEAEWFTTPATKMLWCLLQPAFLMLRPLFLYKKAVTDFEILNIVVQIVFDCLILYLFGIKSLFYLMFGLFIGIGINPMAIHFLAAHLATDVQSDVQQETYSYYGPINMVIFNIGYHYEHHDFPYVSSRNLPKVKEVLSEHYDKLMSHQSLMRFLWTFITDSSVTLRLRVKRPSQITPRFYSGGVGSCSIYQSLYKYFTVKMS